MKKDIRFEGTVVRKKDIYEKYYIVLSSSGFEGKGDGYNAGDAFKEAYMDLCNNMLAEISSG